MFGGYIKDDFALTKAERAENSEYIDQMFLRRSSHLGADEPTVSLHGMFHAVASEPAQQSADWVPYCSIILTSWSKQTGPSIALLFLL